MRRKREPGTRKPLSCPLSKQRMMVCWLTLQILAASPVVNTVFIRLAPAGSAGSHEGGPHALPSGKSDRTGTRPCAVANEISTGRRELAASCAVAKLPAIEL